jgi:hypothetical protein
LLSHQKRAKYCLKLRGFSDTNTDYKCVNCEKKFTSNFSYKRHSKICKKTDAIGVLENIICEMGKKIIELEKENQLLLEDKAYLRKRYGELSLTAVKRPTKSTKNIQINNYIKNMLPLLESDLSDNIEKLTLDHHVKGIEGYAEYALEFPFKDKIVCVDTARNKIKYKNEKGDVIEDVGFRKMITKLCSVLKERSFSLSQAHYEKLSDSFSDSEMDEINFMETALAITKCANGKETDFCNKIVNIISKGSKR